MHVHDSALFAFITFVMVLLLGTLWRTVASYLMAQNPALGGAMATQY